MKPAMFLLCLVLSVLASHAAEIVAWKVPLSRFVWKGLETTGVVRLEAAPEESPFFKEGDELWDLTKTQVDGDYETQPRREWIIWNASSGRLVVKSDWAAIWQLRKILNLDDLPKQCRVKLAIYRVPADGSPCSGNLPPLTALTTVARSAQEFDATQQQGKSKLHAKGITTLYDEEPRLSLRLELLCELPEDLGFELNTTLTLWSGKLFWTARDFDGERGLDLVVSAELELIDGSPLREVQLIQTANGILPLVADHRKMKASRVGNGWFLTQSLSPLDLVESDTPTTDAHDPFAPPSQQKLPDYPPMRRVMPPEFLRPLLNSPVLALSESIVNQTLLMKGDSDFAGYDPIHERLVVYTENENTVDVFDQLFGFGCDGHFPSTAIVTFEGNGQSRLAVNSGHIAMLKRTKGPKSILRSIEIESTIGENDDMIDMRLDYLDEAVPQRSSRLKTAVTLAVGEPLELVSGAESGEQKQSLKIKAEVLKDSHGDGD